MGIREMAVRALDTVAEFVGGRPIREMTGLIDPDDNLYRPIGAAWDETGVSDEIRLVRHRRLARVMYYRSAVGGALPDITVARVVGAGVSWKARDPEVQPFLNRFREDPYNDLARFLKLYATEALVFGELALPIYVTPENGDVRLGYMTPDQIEAVVWRDGDQKRPLAFVQRKTTLSDVRRIWIVPHEEPDPDPTGGSLYPPHPALLGELPDAENRPAGLVQGELGPVQLPVDPTTGEVLPEIQKLLAQNAGNETYRVAGYAFYHRFNTLVCGRGRTIYERVFDWLKGADDFLFGTLRNLILSGYVLFHLQLKGKKPQDIALRRKELSDKPPKPGSFLVTDENETLTPIQPGGAAAATIREVLTGVLKYIGIAAGLPGHELGAEDDTNRSTAKESRSVSINRAKAFQVDLEAMEGSWIRYALSQKVHRGLLTKTGSELAVQAIYPELDSRDESEVATTVGLAVTAMTTAVEARLVLRDDARSFIYQSMGMDLPDPEKFALALATQDESDLASFYARAPMNPFHNRPDPSADPEADPGTDPKDGPGADPSGTPPRGKGGAA